MEATTTSLEALKALQHGRHDLPHQGQCRSHSVHKRAIEIDPNFAVAYASLGLVYGNLGQASLAAENIKKAYDSARSRQRAGKIPYLRLVLRKRHGRVGEAVQVMNYGPRVIRKIPFLSATLG